METATMGKVLVAAKITNLTDQVQAKLGALAPDQVRAVEVEEALIDTGAVYLSLPQRLIDQLGIQQFGTRRVRTSAGVVETGLFAGVRLTVQGRDCTVDVLAVPDDCPVLIGQIPLEAMDFVVDPKNHRLIGNPEHGGEYLIDQF